MSPALTSQSSCGEGGLHLCACAGACLAALLVSCYKLSCCRNRTCCQQESVDVKALKAMFNNKVSTSDSGAPPPQPGFGRAKSDLAHQRLPPAVLSPPMAGPGPVRLPKGDPMTPPIPSRPVSFPRPPPASRPGLQPGDKVKQTGEMLQSLMLRPPGPRAPPPGPNQPPSNALSPPAAPSTPRQQPRQKTSADVTPLRRPLPPEGALPLKPRRPPNVNLKPYLRFKRGSSLPDQRQQRNGESAMFTHA